MELELVVVSVVVLTLEVELVFVLDVEEIDLAAVWVVPRKFIHVKRVTMHSYPGTNSKE